MGTKKRANNKSRKLSKQRNKSKKEKINRDQLIKQLKPTTSLPENKGVHVNWRDVKFAEVNLYPSIELKNKKPVRKPTTEEIGVAYEKIESFHLFREGCNVVRDVQDNSIIALIEFIKFEDLTCEEKEDLNFVTTFFSRATKFINPVSSVTRSWGGLMWALGWRKSCDKDQIIGRYIKGFGPDDHMEFDELFNQSNRLGQVIGNHYKKTAEGPFNSNQQIMKEHHLPSFRSLVYEDQLSDMDCAPHVTFTTNGFFNPPHIDEEDISEYAFAMWLPTRSADGTLACDPSTYDIRSGPFVFPDYQFGINFDHQFGVVKMIWKANHVKHCTMLSTDSSTFTRLGMSVQINLRVANASDRYQKGFYKKAANYFGDHFFYLFRSIAHLEVLITTFLFFLLFPL